MCKTKQKQTFLGRNFVFPKYKYFSARMNGFDRCNKVTGVRWLKKPVEKLKIKITLKPQDGILCLPKFEDYAEETTSLSSQLDNKNEEFSFEWQEKVFSAWELQRYSNIHNCISDIELNYHEMLENSDFQPSKVFTYIHEDYHLPLPGGGLKKVKSNLGIPSLNSLMEYLTLNERIGGIFDHDSSSRSHLFRSLENITEDEEKWTAMHIAFDNSEYNEDAQLLLKQECILLSLYHNRTHNYLLVTPDVNTLELNPYTVERETGVKLAYHYSVDINFESELCSDDLVGLLKKVHKKWERKHKQALSFAMPSLGTKRYYLTLEILTADQFPGDKLYIEFHIKIPEVLKCRDTLYGRSHVTTPVTRDGLESAHFGQLIELSLETKAVTSAEPLDIFLEVISIDWWGRHRTEGYTHLALSLRPGRYARTLSCSRPEERNRVEAMERRFFVGGCHLIQDLEVLAKPQLQEANFRTVSSGTVNVRWSTMSHSPVLTVQATLDRDTSSAAALLKGAEAALRQYKKARARLAAATEGLNGDTHAHDEKDVISNTAGSGDK